MPTQDKEKYYEEFKKSLSDKSSSFKDKTIDQTLNEQSELYYYTQKLNQKLRQKDPENFDKLIKEYGFNKDRPLSPTTRIKGANYYVSGAGGRNFNKSLTVEEQKNILGEDWDRYVDLKKTYGSNLNLFGENEDPNKPETWRVGARHAVAMNPASYQRTLKNRITGNIESDYLREVKYDPTQTNPYVSKDISLLKDKDIPTSANRQPNRNEVVAVYDNNDKIKTDRGVVFKEPKWRFFDVSDQNNKVEIDEDTFLKIKGFSDKRIFNANANKIDINKYDADKLNSLNQTE